MLPLDSEPVTADLAIVTKYLKYAGKYLDAAPLEPRASDTSHVGRRFESNAKNRQRRQIALFLSI
jgi:hypothetical protein